MADTAPAAVENSHSSGFLQPHCAQVYSPSNQQLKTKMLPSRTSSIKHATPSWADVYTCACVAVNGSERAQHERERV